MENQNENWIFLPVHKSRVIKELEKSTIIKVDFDRTTILPKAFRRVKETQDYIFYSLPKDFNANIRVSSFDESSRKFLHKDYPSSVSKLLDECGLDKPYKDVETEIEEQVGESVEPVEE